MTSRLAVVVLVGAAVFGSACKGDPEKCDRACRHYAELVYWDQANTEIAAAPADKQAELRRDKTAKFAADLEHGIDFCVSKCVSANYDHDVQCWLDAKSAADVKACSSD
jgi:hypothetical protein